MNNKKSISFSLFFLTTLAFLVLPLAGTLHAWHHDLGSNQAHFHPESGKAHSHQDKGFHRHEEDQVFALPSAYAPVEKRLVLVSIRFLRLEMMDTGLFPAKKINWSVDPPPRKVSPPLFSSSFNKAPPA